jgi:chromosome segregation ATPase
MASRKVVIDITTTSNTSGADKSAASLEKIAAQQAKAEAKAQEVAAREAARATRAEAAAQKAADVETRRQERLTRQAEVATQKKEAALRREEVAMERAQKKAEAAAAAQERSNQRAIDSAEALSRKNEEVVRKEEANAKRLATLAQNKDTARTGSKVQQAGYQVADFATQVGGGTSAIQALGQQLPQFLGAFGPWGAVIGAGVAVVGALGKSLYELAKDVKAGEESFKRNTEMVKQFAEAYKKAGEEQVQSLTDKLSNQKARLDALQEAEIGNIKVKGEVRDINNQIKTSYLDAEEAALKYLTQTGQVKEAEQALIEIEKQRVQLAKDEATAAANQKLEIAKKQLQDAKDDKAAVERDLIILSKQANDAAQQLRVPTRQLQIAKEEDKRDGLKEPSEATQRLQAIVDGINNKLERYETSIEATNSSFADLDLAISNANTNVDQVQTTLAAEIDKINTQANLTETTTKLTETVTKQTEEVAKIKDISTKFDAQTPLQQKIVAELDQTAANGVITQQEAQENSGRIQTLLATLNSTQSGQRDTLNNLLAVNNKMLDLLKQSNEKVKALGVRVDGFKNY